MSQILSTKFGPAHFDAILPLEPGGLVFGSILSSMMKTTIIPIQKSTMVPDKLIMSKDLLEKLLLEFRPVYNFLIVDDVVATGGSIMNAMKILDSASKIYNFKYFCTIIAIDEIAELATMAKNVITTNYHVMMRGS